MKSFLNTCPFCLKQFYVADNMVGQNVPCTHCGTVTTVRQQSQMSETDHTLPLILGILSLIVPCLDLPFAIAGLILSGKQNYKTGIILSSIGLGLFFVQSLIVIFAIIAGVLQEL